MKGNPEQYRAVNQTAHCVVIAGPGSGKTKTLTTAMARSFVEDVLEPRGLACITFNNECAIELENRLRYLGIIRNDRIFIGTVHSFALTQIITPYAKCFPGLLKNDFRVATVEECNAAIHQAYLKTINENENPSDRWRFADEKRRRDVDRTSLEWRGKNPELADFIESYESELRSQGLIDFEDMPLIAYRMVKDNPWIREALSAKFPVLFVDEYQDLGHALHELVLLLCFQSGIRLFAVGDIDQSIYGFTGANPSLLESLTNRKNVTTIKLRFNYRSGTNIINASMGALGEERNYEGIPDAPDGKISYHKINGGHEEQAKCIAEQLVPNLISDGFKIEEIAVLYRAAWLGDKVAEALKAMSISYIRTDGNALIKRSSQLARFIEACAKWVTGGWIYADPSYSSLLNQALRLVYGQRTSEIERSVLSMQLISFLKTSITANESTHVWLNRFWRDLINPWKLIARNVHQEWDIVSTLISKTDPSENLDMPLNLFSGRIDGSGRMTLSTLHSAKGREFDAVILFGINEGDLPNWRDLKNERATREARRLFYVGVTRPRMQLSLVFEKGNHSPWVKELYDRSIKK